jgi:hypothetical protein
LKSVPLMIAPAPEAPPVRPPVTVGSSQLYVVPAGTIPFVTLNGDDVKAIPLQTVAVIGVIEGLGLTIIVTVKIVPTQLPDVGTTV